VDAHLEFAMLGRIALGALLGFLIGLEREYRGKPAGDRTFALLAMGSAAFVAVAMETFPLTADRVIQGVAAGVGFLGAGIIFRGDSQEPHGLTTAAASWTAAAIGVLAGTANYLTAILMTLLVVLVLESQYMPYVRRLGRKPTPPEPPPRTG
jgi:putative Mg2+ transporter-C (MgtC) family protein